MIAEEEHAVLEHLEETSPIYDEEGVVRSDYVKKIKKLLKHGKRGKLKSALSILHESELGDLLEALDSDRRLTLVQMAGESFDIASLTEVDEAIRLEIVNELSNAEIAKAVQNINSDDAVYILEDMEEVDQQDILGKLPFEESVRLRRSLDYPEETAGRRMQTEFIAVPPFWMVGQVIDYMREETNLPKRFHEIFVISAKYELQGTVSLDILLRTKRDINITEIMAEANHHISVMEDQEEAARTFERYDLLSAAVVDEQNRLVGVLTIDDVVDVIQEEAEEDIMRLGGVGDEELSDSVWSITRSRFMWLLVNLGTAILASLVISMFDATIEQMVALAVLMPIVASMGGNAGTQTMTVAVRSIATRDLDIHNAKRIIRRELLVGLINGCLFALILGVAASLWFSNIQLGYVIALAMVFNMICAALAGILIPMLLNELDADPAIASSVFVTTVTDVVGFFAFLGLAAWWMNLG